MSMNYSRYVKCIYEDIFSVTVKKTFGNTCFVSFVMKKTVMALEENTNIWVLNVVPLVLEI